MASNNNIATATVEINVNGDGGGSGSSESRSSNNKTVTFLRDIAKMMGMNTKALNDLMSVTRSATKLKQSGIFAPAGEGAAAVAEAAAGAATALLTGAAIVGAGKIAADAIIQTQKDKYGGVYDKINVGGTDVVAKVDEKTGQISQILTMREAQEKGILNDTGNVRHDIQEHVAKYDAQTATLERINGTLFMSDQDLTYIESAQAKQKTLQDAINAKLTKQLSSAYSASPQASYNPGATQYNSYIAAASGPQASYNPGATQYGSYLTAALQDTSRNKSVNATPAISVAVK